VKNGRYAVRVSADGLSEDTTLFLHDARAETIGGGCELRGQISHAGRHLIGSMTIAVPPNMLCNRFIDGAFVVAMSGQEHGDEFSLYGLGPLGLIIELAGTWVGE
jgi:hypothetical protein